MYNLVAYKPDSDESCKGCTTGTFSSDILVFDKLSTREELVEAIAIVLAKNEEFNYQSTQQSGFELIVFEDGSLIYNQTAWENISKNQKVIDILLEAKEKSIPLIEENREKRRVAKELREQKEEKQKEAIERRQLADLKKKYEQERNAFRTP